LPKHSLAARRLALALFSIASVMTVGLANSRESVAIESAAPEPLSDESMSTFIGHLMVAESAGRDFAANPRSTALGAFQFIKSTFLDVARRHFPREIDDLTEEEILALRTNRTFARRAARIYTTENAVYLAENGIELTFAHLRLAFLLGPGGAVRLVQAPSDQPVSRVFGAAVLRANPFMKRMTATDLIAKAGREMSERGGEREPEVAAKGRAAAGASTGSKLRCRPQLASCRKAMALEQRRKKARQEARQEAQPGDTPST
jgi:hypothetical protein